MDECYANIYSGILSDRLPTGGVFDGKDYHGTVPFEVAQKEGWRKVEALNRPDVDAAHLAVP